MDPPVLHPRRVTFLPLIVPDLGLVAACSAVLTPAVCSFAAGESHARLHRWWTGPMEELLAAWLAAMTETETQIFPVVRGLRVLFLITDCANVR